MNNKKQFNKFFGIKNATKISEKYSLWDKATM